MTGSRLRALVLLGWLFTAFAATAGAYQDGDSLATNLTLQQRLLRSMAEDILTRSGVAPGGRVTLRADAAGEGWITRQSFAAALQAAGYDVTLAESTPPGDGAVLEVRSPLLMVRYTDPMEDGLFGTRRVRRTISAELSFLVTSAPGGAVRLSETLSRSLSDTIRVDAIPGIESAGINSTRGELPQDRFIDRIVEPFVIVGATGVVVYLLFNIRS